MISTTYLCIYRLCCWWLATKNRDLAHVTVDPSPTSHSPLQPPVSVSQSQSPPTAGSHMAFFTHHVRRGFSSSAVRNVVIKHVTIIGGGQMGAGIAQVSHRQLFSSEARFNNWHLGWFLNVLWATYASLVSFWQHKTFIIADDNENETFSFALSETCHAAGANVANPTP